MRPHMTMHRHRGAQHQTCADRGATAVEYAIIASLIAGVIAGAVTLVGLDTLANWGSVRW